MDWLLRLALSHVRRGRLRVVSASGRALNFGNGDGAPIVVRFTSAEAQRAVLRNPDLNLGEAYMDGTFIVEAGTIADFVDLVLQSQDQAVWPRWAVPFHALRYAARSIAQFNLRPRSRRNVAHHYDLDERLYALFLDSDRQYSCAYFESPRQSLDDAQLAKKRHLAAKLLVGSHHRVLDIGCGWGGLALYLAEMCGARVTGITLSREQLRTARARAEERDLAGQVDFRALDYRDAQGTFDRIVSVGMFEHVGVALL